ncbi:MAG: neutral/alkaline non-lysosomal ceramidase N-terminal domain-containing protein [Phycisphaerales bacterium]|nr:MAG: neutral/alkaline non-lysosomal ceramidase N-terminal domain-containing protein [Phycisphaerales bacterium]
MRRKYRIPVALFGQCLLVVLVAVAGSNEASCAATVDVGFARVDITPTTPIRLSGYAARSTESVGVQQKLWAKAMAIGRGRDTALLITVDCTGLSRDLTGRIKRSLWDKTGIPARSIAMAASHTHSAPMISGYLENLFGRSKHPITAEQQAHIDQYTKELEQKILKTALDAASSRRPSLLFWGRGRVGFAKNRRTQGGPVDHDLPVLKVTDPDGVMRAVVVGYACHGTTLDPADNVVSGDWMGYAQHDIEQRYPGSVAMVVIGAGADSNPFPRVGLTHAQKHGRRVADQVGRVLSRDDLRPIGGVTSARAGTVELDFARAGVEPLPYTIQTWVIGDELAMVFLEGEVVVDYSLRLKAHFRKRLGEDKLWVAAFCNSVPGYVASERILKEGGYEADSSTFYYGLPGRFAAGLEDKIIEEVLGQLRGFVKASATTRGESKD